MKTLYTLFLVLFLASSSFVFSQTHKVDEATGLPNDLDSKYTPDKNPLFNSSSDVYTANSKNSNDPGIKNVVSFDIVNLGRSQATFYYERAINKILSAQVGIGTTFAKDQIQQTFIPVGITVFANNNENNYNNTTNGSSRSLTDILKGSNYSSSGIFFAAGIKLYVSGTAPKGVFFQVGTTYAVSNLLFNQNNNNNYNGYPLVGSPNITVKNLNFNFTWGYQFIVGVGKVKFVNTVYAGIGIKKITYTDVVDYPSYYNSNTANYTTPYTGIDGTQKTVVMPSIIVGFSIGMGW